MKILYIWHAAVEKNYRKLLARMADDHEVILATSHRWYESSKDQYFTYVPEIDSKLKIFKFFAVFHNHIRSFFYPNVFKMILVLLQKPEVIYLKEEPYSLNAFQWVFLAKIFSKKSKIVIESDENLMVKHPFIFIWVEKFVLKKIDALACVPTKGIELYRSKGFNKKIFKTFYFYNEEIFKPTDRELAFKQLEIEKQDGLYIGYAGRITEEKGIEDLIKAFSIVSNENRKLDLLIAGKGTKEYEEKIKKITIENKIEDKVKFLGSLPIEKLIYFYNAIDVFVLPSHSTSWWIEQFGRVIVEAMACGTPVVGSSSGEIPIVINNKELIYEEKNITELANIIRKFSTNEFSKEKFLNFTMSEAKKYSLEEVKKNKVDIMEEMFKD